MKSEFLNMTQAAKAVGITRRTLYNHVNTGKVTVSRDHNNARVISVSELARVYGYAALSEKSLPASSREKNAHEDAQIKKLIEQVDRLEKKLDEQAAHFQLLLEDKQAREIDKEDSQQLKEDIYLKNKQLEELMVALENERKKKIWDIFLFWRK